jgi:hypothetical protein
MCAIRIGVSVARFTHGLPVGLFFALAPTHTINEGFLKDRRLARAPAYLDLPP